MNATFQDNRFRSWGVNIEQTNYQFRIYNIITKDFTCQHNADTDKGFEFLYTFNTFLNVNR